MYTFNYLKKQGVCIYKDGKQILNKPSHEKYQSLKTAYVLGKNLIDEKDKEEYEVDYDWLVRHGLVVASCMEQKKAFSSSMEKHYYITRKETQAEDEGKIPPKHKVIFDNYNRLIRLIGDKVAEDRDGWWRIDRDYKKRRKNEGTKQKVDSVFTELFPNMYKEEDEIIEVKYVVWGISRESELVCWKKTVNPHRVGAIGMSGEAKTFLAHRGKDQLIDKEYGLVVEFNDRKYEMISYITTWEKHEFCSDELELINEFSKPLAMVYFYPTKSEELPEKPVFYYKDEISFEVCVPWSDVIKDYKAFEDYGILKLPEKTKGFYEGLIYDIEKGEYIKDGLIGCKSPSEWNFLINEKTKVEKAIPDGSAKAIKKTLNGLYKTGIFDICKKKDGISISPKWTVKIGNATIETYPWVACLIGGLGVTFETKYLVKEEFYAIQFRFWINSIYSEKSSNPYLKHKHIYFFMDELPDLMKNKKASGIVDDALRAGRFEGVGAFVISQYHKEILPSIKTNLSHMFLFKQTREEEEIRKTFFSNYPEMYDYSKKLKTRHCIACGDFWLVNTVNGKEYSNNGVPIVMKVLPPNSAHKASNE